MVEVVATVLFKRTSLSLSATAAAAEAGVIVAAAAHTVGIRAGLMTTVMQTAVHMGNEGPSLTTVMISAPVLMGKHLAALERGGVQHMRESAGLYFFILLPQYNARISF